VSDFIPFVRNDGGRAAAGFTGSTGDCVTRAIAIATGVPYIDVYNYLKKASGTSPRDGMHRKFYDKFLIGELGWKWQATMTVGSGCRVHLDASELPTGRIVCRLSRHLCAVIDGVLHDTYDCSDTGTWVEADGTIRRTGRCVYGYFSA